VFKEASITYQITQFKVKVIQSKTATKNQ